MDRIEQLKELMKSGDPDSFLQHALALEYIKAGNDRQAESLFEDILSRDPGYVGSYYHLGKLFERNGRPGEAISIYEKGITQAGSAGDLHSMGELRSALQNLEDDLNN